MTASSLAPGTWVQLDPSRQSPRAPLPSAVEQTIGKILQAYTAQGQEFYQVIWNPGSKNPKVATYYKDELTALSAQDANNIRNQIAAGNYTPNTPKPSSNFKEQTPPAQALPQTQPPGLETL